MTNNSHASVISPARSRRLTAFTLIEMLLVVAVIGILTSLVIAAVSNSAADARLVIARQQQAVVQEALNAWIASTTVAGAKSLYDADTTASGRFNLVKGYLDTNARWVDSLTFSGANMQSENMVSINVSMTFDAWNTGGYPSVKLLEP